EPQLRSYLRHLRADRPEPEGAEPAVAGHRQGRRLAGPELRQGPPIPAGVAAELRQVLHQRQGGQQVALCDLATARHRRPAVDLRRRPSPPPPGGAPRPARHNPSPCPPPAGPPPPPRSVPTRASPT